MKIREAKNDDTTRICEIHRSSVRILARDHYSTQEINGWVGGLTPASYEEVVQTRECFVAEKCGEIVGFGQLKAGSERIEAVFVAPECSRQGVGAALLSHLEWVANAQGIRCLQLSASLNSVEFYTRAGYREQGRGSHRLLSGKEIACVHMIKEL